MALLIFALPLTVNAEEIIKKGESLNLERCIEIAVKMQPSIAAAANNVNANASRVGEAKSNYYPQINWTSSYNRISSSRSSNSFSSATGTSTSSGGTGSVQRNRFL